MPLPTHPHAEAEKPCVGAVTGEPPTTNCRSPLSGSDIGMGVDGEAVTTELPKRQGDLRVAAYAHLLEQEQRGFPEHAAKPV